jgi:hypothetical protein
MIRIFTTRWVLVAAMDYHYSLRNDPEEGRIFRLLRGGSKKPHIYIQID